MDRVSVNPKKIRCLGNIVSVKTSDDFGVLNGTITSSTDTVNNQTMTVYSTDYLTGSKISLDCPDEVSNEYESFTVTATLKDNTGTVVSGATVYCDVNGTVTDATTGNDGKVSFTVPTTNAMIYQVRVYYKGSVSLAGSSMSATAYAPLVDGGLVLYASPIVESAGSVDLVGELSDISSSVSGRLVHFYELYTPDITWDSSSAVFVETGSSGTVKVKVRDAVDGSIIVGETVKVYVEDTRSGVYLESDKSILNNYDAESATLSALVLDNGEPVASESVEFFKNGVSIGTVTTDSDGVATKTYESTGVGDVTFTVQYGNYVSENCVIEDCVYYGTTEYTKTKADNTGSVTGMFDEDTSIELPTKCDITFDYYTTGASSSYEHRLFFVSRNLYNGSTQPTYALYVGNTSCGSSQCGVRNNGSTSGSTYSNTLTCNEYHNIKIARDGKNVKWYIDDMDTAKRSITNASWITNYTDYWFDWHLWGSGTVKVKNIKIKAI